MNNDKYHHHRLGFWLPRGRKVTISWQWKLILDTRNGNPVALDPTLCELQQLLDGNAILKPLSENMLTEIPDFPSYDKNLQYDNELHYFQDMFQVFNVLLTEGPAWKVGLIGCPFNAVLDWPMATASGYMFFLYPQDNLCLKKNARYVEVPPIPRSSQGTKPPVWMARQRRSLLVG
jgi:phosphatidylserine decarboxylase